MIKNKSKLCQSPYEKAFTIFHSDGILAEEAGGEEGLSSPGISAEAWLSLRVRGGKLPYAACLEEGQQTPLLVLADNTADCVGRHCSSSDWKELVPQCMDCSSPLCTVRLGRQESIRRLLIEILLNEFHVSETHPKVIALGLYWDVIKSKANVLESVATSFKSVPTSPQSWESRDEPERGF